MKTFQCITESERYRKVGFPTEVRFGIKPEIALQQISWTLEAGIEAGIVLADAVNGKKPHGEDSFLNEG